MAAKRTNKEVIEAFVLAKRQDGEGPFQSRTGNVFWESNDNADCLYSYGRHFPIAVRMRNPHTIPRCVQGQDFVIVNGENFSPTTTRHQLDLHQSLHTNRVTNITTSLTVLIDCFEEGNPDSWEEEPLDIFSVLRLVNFTKEQIWRVEDNGISFVTKIRREKDHEAPFDLVPGEMPSTFPPGTTMRKDKNGRVYYAHRPGFSLWRTMDTTDGIRTFLAGMDDSVYFVAELSKKSRNVEQAIESLKPLSVKRYETKYKKQAHRQGEWFFVPFAEGEKAKKMYSDLISRFPLPGYSRNTHTATRGDIIFVKGRETPVVAGAISHPEHRSLRLSFSKDPVIFKAFKNTAIRSRSLEGVD